MLRPFRSSRPLPFTLALGLAVTQSVAPLAAQDGSTPAPVEANARRAVQNSLAANPGEMVGPLILRDTPLDQILELVERYTGRVLLRPASLPPGTYTLTLEKPLPKSEALRALETVLNMNGVGLSPLGDRFLKVAPLNLIRTEAPEFIEGSTLDFSPSGRVAAKLFNLSYLRVAEFVPQMAQILSPAMGAAPIIFEKNNSVLITDSISTLQRIESLLATLDRPASAGLALKTYTVANAKASDLVNKIRTLLSGPLAAQIGTATTYQPDDRTNQIILIADTREQPFFDELIKRLDAEASPNTRSEVIFLKHANATEVATLLGQLVSGQNTAASQGGGASNSGAGRSGRRLSNNNNAGGANAGAPGGGAPAPAAAAAAVVGAASDSEEFSTYLTIVADERSNGIVVAGTPNDIKLVKSLVDRIDVLLAQVRIEVVIAEVTLTDNAESGIDSLGLSVKDNRLIGFKTGFSGGSIGGSTDGSFATIDRVADGYNLSGIVSLTTTPRKSHSHILQTPSITTTHNKEAEVFIGETRPVISGTTSGASGASSGLTTSSTVTQQEIGVRLTILPLIGSDKSVQLEIKTEVEDVLDTVTVDGNDQYVIGKRTTESYVSAGNGDIIVLGGLQRAKNSKNTNRLGPIPIIGDLLGSRSRSKTRTELIFFLRPTVLTNSYLDSVEIMKRIDTLPQGKQVREIIDHRPAAAPYIPPAVETATDKDTTESREQPPLAPAPAPASDGR